ncbi:peptidylprolyl isomerase family protein FPR2 TDEL_0C06750 [Torulaspora delbrueckii]|uniref:peptidylprolyl isomerase n=1 Tax=Torulaspora delbrueckii TaxID=4950 RepID=G8ZQS7_TORDE|nr:hypothetical protein TDEL_0C06750 [Torulaspora delbrueckii]CCE91564.1 hypothetical protein TDEL_0C06750 [Torulaspora delbrueckii]
MQFLCWFLSIFAAIVAAGSLKELEIGITKKIPAEECHVKAKPGHTVDVHYTGYLRDNLKQFDSSYTRGTPISFKLGSGQVIKGWDQGLLGMCIGEERKIQIPSRLAYGARGIPGVIPQNADMIFDVKLVGIN